MVGRSSVFVEQGVKTPCDSRSWGSYQQTVVGAATNPVYYSRRPNRSSTHSHLSISTWGVDGQRLSTKVKPDRGVTFRGNTRRGVAGC